MIRAWIAKLACRLTGWQVLGEPPAWKKYVVIGAPHTSNWDFLVALLLAYYFRIEIKWMGKHTIFRPPFGFIFRRLGGVPIDRRSRQNAVEQAIAAFDAAERMVLVIPPEGTRKKTAHWKTGFYYIALGARVPIVLGYVDFPRKVTGLGPTFMPTGDLEADMAFFREFYEPMMGKFPEDTSDVQVRQTSVI